MIVSEITQSLKDELDKMICQELPSALERELPRALQIAYSKTGSQVDLAAIDSTSKQVKNPPLLAKEDAGRRVVGFADDAPAEKKSVSFASLGNDPPADTAMMTKETSESLQTEQETNGESTE